MKNILYSSALTDFNELVTAKNAEKCNRFFCPECKQEMILKKSGNTGTRSKRPHFAHKSNILDCSPEGVLHLSFKTLFYNHLKKLLEEKKEFKIQWNCDKCCQDDEESEIHSANLLKTVSDIKMEYSLGSCKPDILLFNKNQKPFVAIEIVVTHEPEEKTLSFYKENEIYLYQINLESDKDLDNFEEIASRPNIFDYCEVRTMSQLYKKHLGQEQFKNIDLPKKICRKCGNIQRKVKVFFFSTKCWKCNSKMNAVYVRYDDLDELSHFPSFLNICKMNNVFITKKYSKTVQDSYFANTCKRCNAFIGEFFLFETFIDSPEVNTDGTDIYICPICK